MGLLDGRTALITGAGRGIGRGVALALARAGARVVVNDLGAALAGDGRDRGPADQVVAEIAAAGGTAQPNYGSVTDFAQATAMVEQAVTAWGRLDVLVNVAGNLRDRMIFNMTEDEWDAVVAVHLKGAFNTVRAASVRMREQRSGRIVNMSSVSALGAPGQPNYAAAKAGILGLTWSTANALEKYGITCNAIMPSGATRMVDSIPQAREVFERTGKWPSELAAGTERDPENVAPLVVYLASDHAAHVTGQVFHASGFTYTLLAQPHPARAIRGERRWSPEELVKIFPETLGATLTPPPGIGFGGLVQGRSEDEWMDFGEGRRGWQARRDGP